MAEEDRLNSLLNLKPDDSYGDEGDDKEEAELRPGESGSDKKVERSPDEGDDDDSDNLGDAGDSDSEEEEEKPKEKKPAKEESDDEEGEDEEDEEEDESARLKRENEGLKKAIIKLRQKNERELYKRQPVMGQYQQQQKTEPVKPIVPPKIKVTIDDNNTDAIIDPESLEAWYAHRRQMERERESIPDPNVVRIQQTQQATYNYLQEDPARQQVVERVNMADDYLTAQVTSLMNQGYRITDVNDVIPIMRALDIDKQALQMFPEISEIGFEEYIRALSSGEAVPRMMIYRSVERSLKGRRKPFTAPKDRQPTPPKKNNGAPRTLDKSPRSLARKGGSRNSAPKTTMEAEFEDLYEEFTQAGPLAVATMPRDKYDRMIKLGKKLGKDGIDY